MAIWMAISFHGHPRINGHINHIYIYINAYEHGLVISIAQGLGIQSN